jgi:preprotein translocase subunit SecD
MARAADFAFRQAVALCPVSAGAVSEAVKNYASFLKNQHRDADARLVQSLADHFKLQSRSVFQMRLVVDAPADDSELMTNEFQNGSTARAAEVLNLQKTVFLDQTAVQSAQLVKGPQGDRQIEITLTAAGRKTFAEVTREHLHQRLAIVIDGKLLTAPNIQSEITGGKCQITGSFSEAEAKALAAEINAAVKN